MTLRNQPYLPLYVQDFLTDEKLIECSASATGIYIRIMCIMHKSDPYGTILLKQKSGTCQDFAIKLAKQLPYSVEEINEGLKELISEDVLQLNDGILSQKRMIKDNLISEQRSEAGRLGGFAKAKGVAKGVANTLANTEYENEIVNKKEEGGVGEEEKKEFEKFWSLYDKKVGDKEKLFKKWLKLKKEEKELIFKYIPKYKLAQPEKKFRKNPETFLNNKSWNDELIAGKKESEITPKNPYRYIGD